MVNLSSRAGARAASRLIEREDEENQKKEAVLKNEIEKAIASMDAGEHSTMTFEEMFAEAIYGES